MRPNRITWTTFFFLSLVSFALWLKFSYPQLAMTDFSVSRPEAVKIAKDYLREHTDAELSLYKTAAIFELDEETNRYLQKTVGFEGLKSFLGRFDYDMFYWRVRFFAENRKEAFLFNIHSGTGEITGYSHIIDDNEARTDVPRETAQENAKQFLIDRFQFDPASHTLRSNLATIRDNRSDFHFSWQNNSVSVPWSDQANSGTGKLLANATVSGDEILAFNKNRFVVPDQFNRDLDNLQEWGRNVMTVLKAVLLLLLTCGIFIIVVRQNHLAMHVTKTFYIRVMVFSFLLSFLAAFNQYEHILFDYKTTTAFHAHIWRTFTDTLLNALFTTVAILIPSLAGELLHFETSPKEGSGSFLHFIRSTFASRRVAEQIGLGYFVCVIMLGIQSVLVKIGQAHLGVWIEHSWINNTSTAYFPFLAAFTFGFKTSFSEEIFYRLYAINLGKKLLGRFFDPQSRWPLWVVGVLTAAIWGLAHSNYPIYPMWFRGMEVSCLGFFLVFIYLRFGIIPVLVGHYLFDVFWNCAGYMFGTSSPFYFFSSLFILSLPLALGLLAFVLNRQEVVRALIWQLNHHQLFNLEILKAFLTLNRYRYAHRSDEAIKEEIIAHGWDPAVVDVATEEFRKDGA